ncbi:MAG: preprotein translocase subunit SecY [Actinomycetales bacterium]|nr:preprotein translocase subunit SecY [Actinomycetales bacterium]
MLKALSAAFKTPDLRKKLLFTLGMIGLFRFGSLLPTPGVSYPAVQKCIDQTAENPIYGLINLFSGGALLQLSVFALGIMPYITASIIIQLLTVVIPRLEALKKEGGAGQKTMTQYTRYLTIGLAILQSVGIIALARTPGRLFQGCNEDVLPNESIMVLVTMLLVMVAGTACIMWLAELITDRGVGNGMSLLIFTSIIASYPGQLSSIFRVDGPLTLGFVLLVGLVTIALVVFVEQAQRRIPVQYAKRMVGRRMYGGTSTYIPLKVNMAGVIPVIFASSLLYIPDLIVRLSGSQAGWAQWVIRYFAPGAAAYLVFNFLLIIFFTYFYISITFNPKDNADEMKKYGGFIPGIRAGKPTEDYLSYVISRITLPGSVYLAFIATIPYIAFAALGVGGRFLFGGTSLLIMVGVGLDTVKQIESQLQQRNYEGIWR